MAHWGVSAEDLNQPEWPEVLRAVQDNLAARIHTSLPGRVVSYDAATQTATVELVVQLLGQSVPPLPEVPVVWPGGTAGHLHVPLEAGDTLMVLFSEEDFSGWFDTGSVSAPRVLARHGLHAVAIPGLRRAAAPLAVTTGHVTLAAQIMLHLGADNATNFVALANLVDARLETLRAAFNGHTHLTAGTGAPVGPTALIPATPGDPVSSLPTVAATKVKAI
jgi:hypothetical protein